MQEMFQGFMDVDNIFWGHDIFRWWFYVALLIILVFEKRKATKNSFVWYSIVFLIALFSPLSKEIMARVRPAWQYRARLYSMLPIPYVLALGSILLVDRVNNIHNKTLTEMEFQYQKWIPVRKLLLVCSLCVMIIMGGTDVYQQEWMHPAYNLEKVPQAILELKERLNNQKNICVAVPDSLSSYIRQIAPEFYTPYGRYVNYFGSLISQQNPDPEIVIKKAGTEGTNYIVVYDNEINEENFRNKGFEPYVRVTGYLVYEVKNVPFTRKTYNSKRQLIEIFYLDEFGNPNPNSEGYAGIAYEYDHRGNCTKETYLGVNGKPKEINQGYSSIARTYTFLYRQEKSICYLDNNNQMVLVNGCYETRYVYGKNKRLEKELYYDQNGKLMNRFDAFYAIREIQYDNQDRIIGERYFGHDGNPIIGAVGYASYIRELDQNGKITKEMFFGENDQPILLKEGYASIVRTFTDNGMQTSEMYLDERGRPLIRNTGYAQVRWEFNDQNQRISETYWDENGDPAENVDRCHGYTWEYDGMGNIVTETYINKEGREMTIKAGFSQIRREYNENKKIIKEAYYRFGMPFTISDGFTTFTRNYDEKGNVIEEAYWDDKEAPVNIRAGYALINRQYDEYRRMVLEEYYDKQGCPVCNSENYASKSRKYNDRGCLIREEYYGENKELTKCILGYAVLIREYDSFGSMIRETYQDECGNAVASVFGYDEMQREYNNERLLIRESFYLLGTLVNRSDTGYAVVTYEYDEKGNIVQMNYFDKEEKRIP